MSAAYGYVQARVSVPWMVAAALLAVSAALAVGGSFGAFSVYRFESQSDVVSSSTTTTTGWGDFQEPAPQEGTPSAPALLHGIPLVVGAVVALVAAGLLVLSARRPGDQVPARLLGTCAAGLLVGVVAVIWLELVTFVRSVAASNATSSPDTQFRSTFEIGAGGYLVLACGLVAVVAAVLLLVRRRGPGAAATPPYWPAPPPWPGAQPQWPGAPQPWQPAAPPPEWRPPQQPPQHG